MLAFVGLEAMAGRAGASLSFGAKKRVELARALASKPVLLLFDEPAGGLDHEGVGSWQLVRAVRDRLGVTVLLVEHHMGLVMSLSDQVVVLDLGQVIADGPPEAVRNSPAVTGPIWGRGTDGADPRVACAQGLLRPIGVVHGIDLEVEEGGMTVLLAPTAPARQRRCAPSAAWCAPKARSCSPASGSTGGPPKTSPRWVLPMCRKGAAPLWA